MKTILLFVGLITFCGYSYSQFKLKYTYLIVNLVYDYNKEIEKGYFIISAEVGNPNAEKIYNLKPYKLDKKTVNTGGVFFSKKSVADASIYNYLQNATEALMFLSENNWELINVYNQITSSYKAEQVGNDLFPYTTVSSSPVYYLRKEIH